MKHVLILLLFFSANIKAAAQDQCIIKLKAYNTITNLSRAIQRDAGSLLKIKKSKTLSAQLNIHLIEFEKHDLNSKQILSIIRKQTIVEHAEYDALLTPRSSPNDALFSRQWQYMNDGEGGQYDADIDAPEAWEITTGGQTFNGDEIVVAVLDGGINKDHPDINQNIWTNRYEIPNNNIDDDANGLVDDYNGYNFINNNGDVSITGLGDGHGTPVAGIIGATGNNGKGVSGVNWNVKIMMLNSNQKVSQLISAYEYVYQMRKGYNDSNGTAGAFIVCTNISLGISNARPVDHPLWCEMYDLLGSIGVLSIAATANASVDVDVIGDLPTTCKSNYLIAVTNTNRMDHLNASAATGSTNIDLGAPGESAYTLSNNGGYYPFGGTSAAAPHVAGAVALLYALPIESFAEDFIRNPAPTALLIKDFILEGVDPIADLEDKTVSEGRLNLHQSLLQAQYYYGVDHLISNSIIDPPFPNPTSEDIYVPIEVPEKTGFHFSVYNAVGQLIWTKTENHFNKGSHKYKISFSGKGVGLYYILVESDVLASRQSFSVLVN